jgi:hypothetical protein
LLECGAYPGFSLHLLVVVQQSKSIGEYTTHVQTLNLCAIRRHSCCILRFHPSESELDYVEAFYLRHRLFYEYSSKRAKTNTVSTPSRPFTCSVAQLRSQGTQQHRLRQAQRQLAITHGSHLQLQQRNNELRPSLGGVCVSDPEAGIADPPPPPYTPTTRSFTAEGL